MRPQIAFETIPGHYTGETKFVPGFVIHISGVLRRQNHVEDYNVTLSNVAVLFDYVKDGQLSCAGSSDRVYLEFRDKGGNTVWCYAEMDGEYPQVYDKAPDTIYATAALAVLAILTVPVIRKSYMDVIAAMQDANVDYDKLTTGIYHFCDSFLYDFAKPAKRRLSNQGNSDRGGIVIGISQPFVKRYVKSVFDGEKSQNHAGCSGASHKNEEPKKCSQETE